MTKGWKCKLHVTGVEPGTRAFYVPGCCRCEEKRAAGLVTGNEGSPETIQERIRAKKATSIQRQQSRRACAA